MSFTKPPIIELVIGVQFLTEHQVNSSDLVLFWNETSKDSYPEVVEVTYLKDEFEHLGKLNRRPTSNFMLKLESHPRIRFQFVNKPKDRMIQLQDSRLILNWMRREEEYPRFNVLFQEFSDRFECWQSYSKTNGIGEVAPNQWELTYINIIPQGDLWETPADWHQIFHRLFVVEVDMFSPLTLEDRNIQWRLRLPDNIGRITLSAGQVIDEENRPGLQLAFSARGPANNSAEVYNRLNQAHEYIINLFDRLATEKAKEHWGKS